MFANSFKIPNHPFVQEPISVYEFSLREDHLHYLWKNKAFNLTGSKLTNGKSFGISNFGIHNTHQSGPDFENCEVIMDDLKWYGKVEMHLKSSDWYLHKHQNDQAYNNVVLHVVWKHDKDVMINGRILPTLELQNWVNKKEFDRLVKFLSKKNDLPCFSQLKIIPLELIENQLKNALSERLIRKTNWVETILKYSKTREQAIYVLLGSAFGSKVNNLAFSELLTRVPYSLLEATNFEFNDVLLHATSDLVNGNDMASNEIRNEFLVINEKHDISPMKKSSWIFSGLRPSSFPSIRIDQFARLIQKDTLTTLTDPNFEISIENVRKLFRLKEHNYFEHHYSWGKPSSSPISTKITNDFILGLILNSIIPLHLVFANENKDTNRIREIEQMLDKLPAEKMKAIDWIKDVNIKVKNAGISQAILELNNEFCTPRRCLDCLVGKHLMT
jgi:hypothetical protein